MDRRKASWQRATASSADQDVSSWNVSIGSQKRLRLTAPSPSDTRNKVPPGTRSIYLRLLMFPAAQPKVSSSASAAGSASGATSRVSGRISLANPTSAPFCSK